MIKICKWAVTFNAAIVLGIIWATLNFINLGTNDLSGSTKSITLGISVTMVFFSIISILALWAFIKNNKLTKIYFMLISVFAFPFALGYGEKGFFVMVFLIISLFINISCFKKAHPQKA